ncbi:hypothetical protein [Sphaerisporangium dianthi]|uniref:Uncharacterized protein n=1 Tax=Sphaerisporangium dianthi TaxID=1436120 RepID=A0ABV9CWY8_9ACTN
MPPAASRPTPPPSRTRLAERNRHTLVLLAEHDQSGEQGPWPIGGRR